MLRISCTCVLLLTLCESAPGALPPEQERLLPPAAARKIVFNQDVKPIIESSCIKCHGRGRAKGGLALDTRETLLQGGDSGPAVKPGHSNESLLIALVAGVDPDNVMPLKGSRLTAEQVGLLRAWIDQGVAWDAEISFARPAALNIAPVEAELARSTGGKNQLDAILEKYFAANGLQAPSVVEDRLFARRAALDVTGLLPESGALQEFLADKSVDKRARFVRKLLGNNEAYATHWLSFWNDLLRNDYRGTGYIDGGRRQITGWLYSALLTNMPFDQFVAELVNPSPASEGFTKGILWRGVVNASQSPPMQAAQNIAQVFMGVNLKCASCHDSFINDWRLSDAYGLASIYSDGPLELFQCDKPTGRMSEPRFIYPELGELNAKADNSERMRRLAEIITGPKDGRLPRTIVNRLWARFLGRGLVEPVDDMEQPAWSPEMLDALAADLVANRFDLKKTMEHILTSRAYQLPSVNMGEESQKHFVFRGPAIRRLFAEQFRDAIGQLTGVWHGKTEVSMAKGEKRAGLVAADPLAIALGRPNREQVATSRPTVATTLQALELTNGKTLAEVLESGAEHLLRRYTEPGQLTEHLYQTAFGRRPAPAEALAAQELLGVPMQRSGVADLLWALTMLPEFQLIY